MFKIFCSDIQTHSWLPANHETPEVTEDVLETETGGNDKPSKDSIGQDDKRCKNRRGLHRTEVRYLFMTMFHVVISRRGSLYGGDTVQNLRKKIPNIPDPEAERDLILASAVYQERDTVSVKSESYCRIK